MSVGHDVAVGLVVIYLGRDSSDDPIIVGSLSLSIGRWTTTK